MARAFGSRLGYKQVPPPNTALLGAVRFWLPGAVRTVYRAGGGSACGRKASRNGVQSAGNQELGPYDATGMRADRQALDHASH